MKKLILICSIILALIILTPDLQAQNSTVSMSERTHINDAVIILDSFSVRETSKRVLNLSSFNELIGVPVSNLPWRTAMDLIALRNNLVITDAAGYIAFSSPAPKTTAEAAEAVNSIGTNKQVRIKAVALVADKAFMQSLGIDWSTLLNGSVNIDVNFTGAQNVPGSIFGIGANRITTWQGNTIEVNTLLRTIENEQKGTIIAQPVIMVNSGSRGYIQVGQDISVKTVDEAGNTTDEFFATGVILDVQPTIINVSGQDLVHLILSIERSSGTPGNVSTIINRSKSTTELVLYNGEETVIGGLYDTDETRVRGGIPILKDLPWWVLGIRYLTGYYKYERKERELLIMLKVDIVEDAVSRSNRAREAALRSAEEQK